MGGVETGGRMYTGNGGRLFCSAGWHPDRPHLLFIEWCFAPTAGFGRPACPEEQMFFCFFTCPEFWSLSSLPTVQKLKFRGEEVTGKAARPEQSVCCYSMLSWPYCIYKGLCLGSPSAMPEDLGWRETSLPPSAHFLWHSSRQYLFSGCIF